MVSGRLSMNNVNINSRNKVKELEVFSKSTTQMEKDRTQLQELFRFSVWSFSGVKLKGLIDAAENYHNVLAENRKLYNEELDLKGTMFSCTMELKDLSWYWHILF
ncbi:kinesin-like protein KIN-14C isoform X1 [Rhododendron vialii]|uniref:kinesin-like protein KIN-14C isoform X1 n=1 Tax=Rhododendron vialii TaxID=182163 RepID=UPI00265F9784|nr:kinesin-like protein KIN-14C isoform X1 [Rhododendron vialii]XP_058209432.1 kinesin-like protein KIN-14C isoform X1 [Rhododendron vialii]